MARLDGRSTEEESGHPEASVHPMEAPATIIGRSDIAENVLPLA